MKTICYLCLSCCLWACTTNTPKVNIEEEKKAILTAVEQYAQLMQENKHEKALRSMFPTKYTVVNAQGYHDTYVDTVARQSIQYIKANNLRYDVFEPQPNPLIEVSSDGTMAYAIARIKMEIVATDSAGNEQKEERMPTFFSSLKKEDGKWVIAVSSQHR